MNGSAPLLFDATHTSHTRAQTGIQRIVRSLYAGLAKTGPVTGICHDPYLKAWRPLDPAELNRLRPDLSDSPTRSRASHWSYRQRFTGRIRRLLGARPEFPSAGALVCPELFPAQVGARLPEILARVSGPRIAIFYDAIPLQYPELTPPATVARFPAYLQELLLFDGIAAISEASASRLREYWQWLGVAHPPPVQALPLAIEPLDPMARSTGVNSSVAVPRILCVSTIEGRKNHLALLDACDLLWQEGLAFELQLIGLPRADTARSALDKITSLQQAGRALLYTGVVPEAELQAAYRQCTFTVYPSLIEGFGLPVLESLQHGKPCLCSAEGAVGEAAREGGCLTLKTVDATQLKAAIARLLKSPSLLESMAALARGRRYKTWPEYVTELTTWMQTLNRRL